MRKKLAHPFKPSLLPDEMTYHGINPSFPGLSTSPGQVDYVLLSRTPRPPQQGDVRLAWLNLDPIAVGSGRINRSRLSGVGYAISAESYSISKAHVGSNIAIRSPLLYAHLEVVRVTARALP